MAKNKDQGWIKVFRTFFESELWLAYPFTPGQAWIDLIGLANYADTEHFFRGKVQIIRRGQLVTSDRFLADRWKWSKGRVRRYIKTLVFLKMVTTDRTTDGTTITIENYEKYQSGRTTYGPTNEPTDGTSDGTSDGPTGGTQKKNIKNIKNKKKGGEAPPPDLSKMTPEERFNYFVREEGEDDDE